ncbi:MAG TPA: 4'-phosphopantetheinyl transferase superfamily protein [Anaerolineales bacterium]|nr:4'-phosphopantetheinyl transferase superfamily protein [Anaerolineales bacterium]
MQKTNAYSVWSPPPDNPDLQPHQVDIWRARLDLPMEALKGWEAVLSSEEAERAARFHFPKDRDRYIAAHGFLRGVLSRYLLCTPDELTFSANDYGKPVLIGHKLEFNLSHSGDFALVALTRGYKIGVDLERVRQGISSLVIARQYFSKSEIAELQGLPLDQREAAFFTCWTRKEAYIKAQGLGLSLPLESFDVSLTPNQPTILRATRPDADEAARWTLRSLEIDPRYAAAVAVEGKDLEFKLLDWNAS